MLSTLENQFLKTRDKNEVEKSLSELKISLDKNINLLPPIITAVKNNCTLGEICSVLKEKYGEHY